MFSYFDIDWMLRIDEIPCNAQEHARLYNKIKQTKNNKLLIRCVGFVFRLDKLRENVFRFVLHNKVCLIFEGMLVWY